MLVPRPCNKHCSLPTETSKTLFVELFVEKYSPTMQSFCILASMIPLIPMLKKDTV